MNFWKILISEIIVMLVVLAIIVASPFLIQKEWRYQTALKQYKNGKYTEASATFFSLKKYHRSEELAELCQKQFYEGINRDYKKNNSYSELFNLLKKADEGINKEDVLNYFSDIDSDIEIRQDDYDDKESFKIQINDKHADGKRVLFRWIYEDIKTNLSFLGVGDNVTICLYFEHNQLVKLEFSYLSCALSPEVFDYMTDELSLVFGYVPAIENYREDDSEKMKKMAMWKNQKLYFNYPYPFEENLYGDFLFYQQYAFISFSYEYY